VISGDDKWNQVATLINSAVEAALTTKPGRSGVVPGEIAWDDCDCGLLATSWVQNYLSDLFPEQVNQVTGNCGPAWDVSEIVVQIIRCAPSPSSAANAPTPSALAAAALLRDIDGNQMQRAVSVLLCQMKDAYDIIDYFIQPRTPQGPAGGCVGSELRMLVALPRG
jgi:hypothetical protein